MANRFTTRLADGPAIVADGGMGSLITAAVPGDVPAALAGNRHLVIDGRIEALS